MNGPQNAPPRLTDREQLSHNRGRAKADGMFLQELAIAEIKDRLTEVNRTFTKTAIVTGFPNLWARAFPEATIVADTDTLDLTPGAHDLVIHAMTLHWADDPIGQLIQCRNALINDGLLLGVMFGGQTLSELRAVFSQVEIDATGGLSPRVLPMGEIRDLGALLQRAGFALPVADSAVTTVTYQDVYALMRDLRLMGERNAQAQRKNEPLPKRVFDALAAQYKDHFSNDEGRILASFELIYLTGWSPDASQQQPLRPGSAVSRLADALGTGETKLSN